MRRVQRVALDKKTENYLLRRQADADKKSKSKTLKTDSHWNSSRQTMAMGKVFISLQNMMGPRQRCMYCVDSHGCDIEHFHPKAIFTKWMYDWENLLLCCTECGRLKGNKFPSDNGKTMLIDPSKEEPWNYLDFDPITGNITAKFDITTNSFHAKGEKTVETLQLDRREAVAVGYLKTFRNLSKRISTYLQTPTISTQLLISELIDHDEHALLGWFFKGNGQFEQDLSSLKIQFPTVWKECQRAFKFY